jgi:RNA recognition motif-containing protein
MPAWKIGQSRGFGFITYYDAKDAEDAIRGMDGRDLDGRYNRSNKDTA